MGIIEWNVSPILLDLGVLQIRWYGLLFALSFVWGNYFLHWVFNREKQPLQYADRLLLHMILGTVIGARLGHTLFYDPAYYLSHPIEILKIWRGGLASHGAGIGIFIAIWLYVKKTPEQTYFWILDRMAIVVSLSACFIRLGNLMNSEIIGLPTGGDWGVIFRRIDSIPRHPAQVYESGTYFLIFLILGIIFLKTNLSQKPGFLGGLFLILVFTSRFFIENFKENQVAFEQSIALNMGQLLSIPMVLLGTFLLLRSIKVTRTIASS